MSFPMVGLTDGMGNVAGLPDEDEPESFLQTVGNSVSSQFDIVPGLTPAAPGDTYVPPPADAGSTFFESDMGFTEYDSGPAYAPAPPPPPIKSGSEFFNPAPSLAEGAPGDSFWEPQTTFITNEDYFGDLYGGLPQIGDAPLPGMSVGMDGSQWFGTAEQQQQQYDWWQSEVDKAIRNGDKAKYDALMQEINRVDQGWLDFETANGQYGAEVDYFNQQLGALDASVADAFAFNPQGEGGFSRTRTDQFINPSTGNIEYGSSFLTPNEDIRGYMDAAGTPMVDTPYGPMHFTDAVRRFGQDYERQRQEALSGQAYAIPGMDRAAALEIFPQFDDWLKQQRDRWLANNTYWAQPQFAGQTGDPFAEGTFADYRDFAMSQGDLRYDTGDSAFSNLVGNVSGNAVRGLRGTFGNIADVGRGIGSVVGAVGETTPGSLAWAAITLPAEYAWQGLSYKAAGERYITERIAEELGIPPEVAGVLAQFSSLSTGSGAAGQHYRSGDGLVDTMRQSYDTQPMYVRIAGETVYDPWNVVGAGLIAKGVNKATAGRRFTNVQRGSQEFIDAGWTSEQVVADFIATKPSWKTTNELAWSADRVSDALISQTGIPTNDIANLALGRNLIMEMHIASRGIDATDPIAMQRSIEATRTRVINEMVGKVETRYGTKVANQVQRQLNTPQVQQVVALVANPNTIPISNGRIAVVEGNQITGLYSPGSGRNLIPRNTLPSGLTRTSNGNIVTVSRKTADDALESAVSADTLVNDSVATQRTIDAPVPSTASQTPIVENTLPDPVLDTLLPPVPPRVTPEPIDASVTEMRWLEFFGKRDGVNYVDEIVTSGDTSRIAVANKLQEIDNGGKATAAQLLEMERLGVAPSRRAELANLSRQQADHEIARLGRTQPRPDTQMTWTEYKNLYPEGGPFKDDQVQRAIKYGNAYGVDFLRQGIEGGLSPTQFYDVLSDARLPATSAQRRVIEQMVREGKIKAVDLDSLTNAQAQDLMKTTRRINAVESIVQHGVAAPLEVVDDADVAAQQAADAAVTAKQKAQDYLRRHLPEFTAPPSGKVREGGFRTAVKGKPATDQGVQIMSPLALRQWATDILSSGALNGTDYAPLIDDLSRAIIHVNQNGLLSSGTVSAHFETLVRQMAEMAGTAEPDDTRRLIDALDEAYNGSRYSDITTQAGRRVRGVSEQELAERVDRARRQLPTVEADLADIRRKLNDPSLRDGLSDREVRDLRARRAALEEQQGRLLDLTNPKGKDAPRVETAQQQREVRQQASSEQAKTYAPNLGERPPIESDQSLAGLASDHDIQHTLITGNVPQVEPQIVIQAGRPGRDAEALRLFDRDIQRDERRLAGMPDGPNKDAARVSLENLKYERQEFARRAAPVADDATTAFLATSRGRQARNMVIGQGNTRGMADRAFTNAGTTREAVEAALRRELGGTDMAAGGMGGYATIDAATAGLARLIERPKKVPTIEPNIDIWRNADWDAVGPHLDEYAKQFYDVKWIMEQDNRLRIGGVALNPTELTKAAKVWKAGDYGDIAFRRWVGDAKLSGEGYQFFVNKLREWVDGDINEIVKADAFFKTKEGAETLRLIRRTGKAVLDDIAAIKPHRSITDLGPGGPLPMPTNGKYSIKQVQLLDDIINGRTSLRGMSQDAREQLYNLRQSDIPKQWNEKIRPLYFTEGKGWTDVTGAGDLDAAVDAAYDAKQAAWKTYNALPKGSAGKVAAREQASELTDAWEMAKRAKRDAKASRGVDVELIDSILFEHAADIEDLPKFANRLGTRLGEEYGKLIGYDPDRIPWWARPMMWVKAQLTPIWMTIMPTYHMNNIAGNWMAMLIESFRGRGSTLPVPQIINPTSSRVVDTATGKTTTLGVFDDPMSGWSYGNWINNPGQGRSQFTESTQKAAELDERGRYRPAVLKVKGKTLVPNTGTMIDFATGGFARRPKYKGVTTLGEDFGGWSETLFKKSIYTQNAMAEAPKLWRAELDQMMRNGTMSPDQVDAVIMAKGLHDVRSMALSNGLDAQLDQLLARYRGVIGTAQHRAYTIASDAMRDYRMRNKIDGFMDQFLPVHFWATKNMLYVSKAAMDRPALAVSAGQAYNAWVAEHKDDPLSITTGYLKAPAEMVPFLPEGSEYWLRMTQLTNPVFFALPKLIAGLNRDIVNAPGDQSAWERFKYYGKNGVANAWEASGNRLGPQWDWAIKIANRLNQNPDGADADIMFAANFLTAPYTDHEGKRRPGQQNVVPFGGWESLLRKLDITVAGTNISVNDGMKWLNELATGSPYTNYEVSQAAFWMKEDTFINYTGDREHDTALQIRLETALAAMGSGNYDDPYVQQAMGNVLANSAEGFLRGRIGLHAGREYSETNARVDDAWTFYNHWIAEGNKDGKTDPSILWQLPAELRWIIRDSGATQSQIDAAVKAAGEGKDHPLLKRSREATGTESWGIADQLEFARMIFTGGATYDQLVEQHGKDYAADKMFGTYNQQTRKRDSNGLLPGMEALFMATSPDRMAQDANENLANRNWNALRDMNMANQMDENHRATPYFARLNAADEALRSQVAKAGGDMRLVDLAFKSYSNITGKIYDEAQEAGLDLGPSGLVPSQGRNYYTRTQEEKNFLEWNGALEAVEGRERQQARQGFVLDRIEEQLGVNKYFENGTLNTQFVDLATGEFDQQKYDAAVADAAQQAPALFNAIVLELRDLGSTIEMGVGNKGIKSQDFLDHIGSKNPELDAFREQRRTEVSAFYDMESGPEKNAEAQRLQREYGEEVLDRNYRPTGTLAEGATGPTLEGVTSPDDHRRYDQSIDAAANFYYSLSPGDKDAFEAKYPDAFEKVEVTNAAGETYQQNKLFSERLTSEQAAEIVAENGLDTTLVRGDRADRVGQLRGTPDEQQRRMDADLTYQYRSEYFDLETPEEQLALDMNNQLKDDPLYAEAQALKDVSLSKAGNPNWYTAKRNAEAAGNTELAEFIGTLQASNAEVGPIYDKRDAWFAALPDDVKAILIANDPATFERYADSDADFSGPSVSDGGQPESTSSGRTSGGGSYTSNYRPYASNRSYRSSGSSYRGGGGSTSYGSSTGGNSQPVLNQILALDPFLASGQDDGRLAVAQQVSDHVNRLVSAISMFAPDKRMTQFFTGLWLQFLTRSLGPNPDLAAWSNLLARLTRGQPTQAQPAQPQTGYVSPQASGQPDPATAMMLGGY